MPISVDALIAREQARIDRVPTEDFERVWKNIQRALHGSGPAKAGNVLPPPQRPSVPVQAAATAVRSLVLTAVVSAVTAAGAIGAILWGLTRRPPSEVPAPSPALSDAGTTLIGSSAHEIAPPAAAVSTVKADELPDVATDATRAWPPDPARRDPSSKLPVQALPHAEESWIKLARTAIQRRDYPQAKKFLDEHARAFPQGVLSDERSILLRMLPP